MSTKEDIEDQILQLKGEILEKETQLRKLERIYGKMKEGDTTPKSNYSSINNEDNIVHRKDSYSNNKIGISVPESPIGINVAHNKSIITPLGDIFLSKGNPSQPMGQQVTPNTSLSLHPQTKRISKYYVLFSGPNQGVYTEWARIAPLIGNHHHQSFNDPEEAQRAYFSYQKASSLNDQKTYSQMAQAKSPSPITFRPQIAQTKLPSQRPGLPEVIRNRLNRSNMIIPEDISTINKDRFYHYFNMAEAAEEDDEQKFFTVDKKSISLYAFYENAKPEIIRDIFDCGLLALVYPSSNLQEINLLPKPLLKAIKNYRTKVIGLGDREIYLKITSSLLDWNEDKYFYPYHWIEIGVAKPDVRFQQPQAKKATEDINESLKKLRPSRIKAVYQKYAEIYSDSNKKLNYADSKTIIISNFSTIISTQELETIARNEARFLGEELDIPVTTKKEWCRVAPTDHHCIHCNNDKREEDKESSSDSFFEM